MVTTEREEMEVPCLLKTNESTRHLDQVYRWGSEVVSHVSKSGRHGAPDVVGGSWFRETCGRRVWSPMSPTAGDMGYLTLLVEAGSEDLWGKGVVSHVPNGGRHGAPDVVVQLAWGTRVGTCDVAWELEKCRRIKPERCG